MEQAIENKFENKDGEERADKEPVGKRPVNKEVVGFKLIVGYLGVITMMLGIIVLIPILILVAYPSDAKFAKYFLIAGGGAILVGFLCSLLVRGKRKGRLLLHQDAIIVMFTWIIAVLLATLPFLMYGGITFSEAVFESASMWTTTGITMLNVDAMPHIFLIFRALMQFFGGIGFILIMLSVLSDSQGMKIYNAEGHSDKLLPNLAKSAKLIFGIYAAYVAVGAVLYIIFGMHWFDAINYAMGAVSTGGVGSTSGGLVVYDSVPIETITVVLMILGGTSFFAHMYLLRGKFKNFFNYCEVKFFFIAVAVASLAGAILLAGQTGDFLHASRISVFTMVSAITTTGYQTVASLALWPSALLFLLVPLMLMGGGTGSTSGGIKQYRVYILFKDIYWSVRDRFGSKRVVRANVVSKPDKLTVIDNGEKADILSFVLLFLLIYGVGVFIVSCYGYELQSVMFDVASCMGTVGLNVGIMVSGAPAGVLWVGIATMLLGRLEIYVIIFAVLRIALDAKRRLTKNV